MVISASLLLATCVGCSSSSAQPPQSPAATPQPGTAPTSNVPTHSRVLTNAPQLATPDASSTVEWSARSRESSLSGVLKLGSQGAVVTRLQVRLARLGYAVEKIDGLFGSQTQAKVMQFQQAYGLLPDGIVETNLWKKLNQDIALAGQVQRSLPVRSTDAAIPPASPSSTVPSVSPSPLLAASAEAPAEDEPASQKTGWVVVLVAIQGFGWLVILQGVNKDLILLTGRSLFPGKTKQWLFSIKH